jgi:hypothetical protein
MPVAATESSRAAMVAMVVVVGRWRFGGMIICDAILFLRQVKPLGKRLPPKQKSQGNPKCKICIGKFFETIVSVCRVSSAFRSRKCSIYGFLCTDELGASRFNMQGLCFVFWGKYNNTVRDTKKISNRFLPPSTEHCRDTPKNPHFHHSSQVVVCE